MTDRFTLPAPDDSAIFFQSIIEASNKKWQKMEIESNCYGYQIQSGTKWRKGLTESQIDEFQKEMGFEFPHGLRTYFSIMNGLDTLAIDVHAMSGYPPSYGPKFYSYPEDIPAINEMISWVLESNNLIPGDLPGKASRIFPIMGHRFLLIDDPMNRVLSMFGDDIIYWADNLSWSLIKDIFPGLYIGKGHDYLKKIDKDFFGWKLY